LSGLAPAQELKAPPVPVFPVQEWNGKLPGDKIALRKLAPKAGYILEQESWSALWKAWRGGKAPVVNFQTQFVVVGTARGATDEAGKPNRVWFGQGGPSMVAYEGNLQLQTGFAAFDMDTPGFAYTLAVVQRGGITAIDGKALPQPRIDPMTIDKLATKVKELEKANAEMRAALEELRKQIEELKKPN
jgi:hypothetical protein